MPSPSDSLTSCGGWYECVGVNHTWLGQLPENCFVVSKTPLIPGYLHSSTPSPTVMTWEQELIRTMCGIWQRAFWRAVCLSSG